MLAKMEYVIHWQSIAAVAGLLLLVAGLVFAVFWLLGRKGKGSN